MREKVLSLFLAMVLSFGLAVPAMAKESGFADVAPNAYYAEAVSWAVERGITNGTGDTTFSPDQTCTRAQIAAFIWRARGCPEPELSSSRPWTYYVPDVQSGTYYSNAARWLTLAMNSYLVSNDKPIAFRPNDPCTRLEAVEFLHSAYGYEAVKSNFSDVSNSKAVDWAASWGITNGTSENTFSPNAVCTRGQIVTFLHRAAQQPDMNDAKALEGIYVQERNPDYELKVQYINPRFHVVFKSRKYDAVGMTGNLIISSNAAYTDGLRIIFYPGYLIYESENSFLSGKYILESGL